MKTDEAMCKQLFCNVKKQHGHEASVNIDVCSSVLNLVCLTMSLHKTIIGGKVGWGCW
jgi:hypothetical protein